MKETPGSTWLSTALNLVQSLAIVVTLGFTAQQYTKSIAMAKASHYDSVSSQVRDLHMMMIDHPAAAHELAQVLGLPDGAMRSEDDIRRHSLALAALNFAENAFHQYSSGLIDESAWAGWRSSLPGLLASPTVSELWIARKRHYPGNFVEFMETYE